jgi:hypothetical protein
MQPEYAVPPVDVALLGTNASATSDHLASATATMLREDPDTHERWQTWRARGAKADRETARTTKRGFIGIFLAASAWLVFQLLS